MTQDAHQRARERYQDASDAFREQRVRMVEDLRFSNPADPQQWDMRARQVRENGPDGARPCLTLDRTNQYIAQVVNDARQNKPGPLFMPSSGGSRQEVARALDGIARHIEYQSRAQIAYDTAVEHAARIGLGWIRILPEVCNAELNHQEVRIKRVHDPLSVLCDPDWAEPDGSDIQYGFIETLLSDGAFKRKWPKASQSTWESNKSEPGWFSGNSVRVAEYFDLVKTKANKLVVQSPDGVKTTLGEDYYWKHAKAVGYQPLLVDQYVATEQRVMWRTMNGVEILEETESPSRWIPLIPVIGYELWIEGKRYLCGMTRRMMESQRAYNYERSAWVESVALQPRAPVFADAEAIAGHEDYWARMNRANLAYIPYNSVTEDGRPLQIPTRINPPQIPTAFAQGAQFANSDIEASIGMYSANLGKPSNETSGRAINARQKEGDTANFHYIDNLSRSIEHCWRVVLDMIPRLYDEPREARILGEDGSIKSVIIDPNGDAYSERDDGSATINLGTGIYDVRVKTGPAYTTLRQEAAENLTAMMQGNPALAQVIAPIWARMQDWPESDKLSKALLSMAPAPVQAALGEGQAKEDPEVLKQQLQQQEQQLTQMHQMLEMAAQKLQELQSSDKETQLRYLAEAAKIENDQYAKVTERIKAMQTGMTPEQVQALVIQTLQNAAMAQPEGAGDLEQAIGAGPDVEGMQAPPEPSEPPGHEQQEATEAPEGAFSLPASPAE